MEMHVRSKSLTVTTVDGEVKSEAPVNGIAPLLTFIIHVCAETGDEQNKVRETDRAAVEATSPIPPPSQPTVPPNPCEGETFSLITAPNEQLHPSVYLHQSEERAL